MMNLSSNIDELYIHLITQKSKLINFFPYKSHHGGALEMQHGNPYNIHIIDMLKHIIGFSRQNNSTSR